MNTMTVEAFLEKLFENSNMIDDGNFKYIFKEDNFIRVNIKIDREGLKNNIDVLARELHMLVETEAEEASKYQGRQKHSRIYIPDFEDIVDTEPEPTVEVENKWKNI
jgi:hypothetical protein